MEVLFSLFFGLLAEREIRQISGTRVCEVSCDPLFPVGDVEAIENIRLSSDYHPNKNDFFR